MAERQKVDAATALTRVGLFAGLPAPALDALASKCRARWFQPGEQLFREGDACAGVFVLAAGTVRIFKLSGGGRELTLHNQKAPSTVAEVPLVDGGLYPASVEAQTGVEAYFLPREHFLQICESHPQVALAALRVFGQRLRALVELVEAVTFGGVRQRLARLLLDQGAQLGKEWQYAGTHQQMALELGTVREVVSRNLSRFQSHDLIRIEPRRIVLLDREGLGREAQTAL